MKSVFTYDEAARIVEAFEDVLEKYDVTLPSGDDDGKDETNTARLYGDTYSELLDYVEYVLVDVLDKYENCKDVVTGVFSGNY